jgi:hypothetical protein
MSHCKNTTPLWIPMRRWQNPSGNPLISNAYKNKEVLKLTCFILFDYGNVKNG